MKLLRCVVQMQMSQLIIKKLPQMKYMDMVIKETLRMYPPVPAIGRYIDQDIDLGKH